MQNTNLTSVRIITDDVSRLVTFYEQVMQREAVWSTPKFAEVVTDDGTLAIGHSDTVPLFGAGVAHAADNHTVILEFAVDDVDAEHTRLVAAVEGLTVVQEPTTMPWGNRSLLVRDPDGSLVNLFTPGRATS